MGVPPKLIASTNNPSSCELIDKWQSGLAESHAEYLRWLVEKYKDVKPRTVIVEPELNLIRRSARQTRRMQSVQVGSQVCDGTSPRQVKALSTGTQLNCAAIT